MDKKQAGARGIFQIRLLSVIREITEIICNFNRTEYDILTDVINIIESRLNTYGTKIVLAIAGNDDLIVACCKDVLCQKQKVKGKGLNISRRVRVSGEPLIINNISTDEIQQCRVMGEFSRRAESSTLICVPVIYQGKCTGSLSTMLDSDPESDFSFEVNGLSIIAGLIANVVGSKRELVKEKEQLQSDNDRLRSLLSLPESNISIIGESASMKAVLERVKQVAVYNTTIFLQGDSGTGKELIADAIHFQSERAGNAIVKLNCSALNSSLFESELFGHVKGAFTGAEQEHHGYIAQAEGGTLFFDEIADFSQEIQVKLLRFIQERRYQLVGSSRDIDANVRIVVASRMDLAKLVQEGKFREDLWYRINGFIINIPPLRERREDILPLANYYMRRYTRNAQKDIRSFSQQAIDALLNHNWPGNVRELQNWIEYGILTCTGNIIEFENLPVARDIDPVKSYRQESLKHRLASIEKEIVLSALKTHDNHIQSAAEELGITPRMLNYKIKDWEMDLDRAPRRRLEK